MLKLEIINNGEFGISVRMKYPEMEFVNSENRCLMRKEVKEMLINANQLLLKKNLKLRIWDAWRPFKLQEELYEKYKIDIINTFNLYESNEQKKQEIINKFVSLPNKDIAPLHTTGGAIDVTLLNNMEIELDMGTKFDEFSDKTYTKCYELNTEQIENRMILYDAMISSGFVNLESEWWHFDYGDREWARQTGMKEIYNGIFKLK